MKLTGVSSKINAEEIYIYRNIIFGTYFSIEDRVCKDDHSFRVVR